MRGRTHLLFAILLGIFYFSYFKFKGNIILFFIFLGLASLLPDIDHPNSLLGRKLGLISQLIHFLFGHRKLFHSIFFIVVISIVVFILWPLYLIPVLIGLVSHIILDMLSKEGIILFYPFNILKIKGFLKVGGIIEFLISLLIVIAIILKLIYLK